MPEEGDIELGPLVVAQDDELLVVQAPAAHPHVQEALAACGVDLVAQVPVLCGGEGQAIPVGAPYQAANVHAASASTFPIPVSGVSVRRSSGSPRQSVNISRSPSRICDTRWRSSAKYAAPWIRGRTRLPSVHAMSPRWRASSRVEWFPLSRGVRNHCVVSTFDPFPLCRFCNPCGLRRSQHRGNRTRPSVLV